MYRILLLIFAVSLCSGNPTNCTQNLENFKNCLLSFEGACLDNFKICEQRGDLLFNGTAVGADSLNCTTLSKLAAHNICYEYKNEELLYQELQSINISERKTITLESGNSYTVLLPILIILFSVLALIIIIIFIIKKCKKA